MLFTVNPELSLPVMKKILTVFIFLFLLFVLGFVFPLHSVSMQPAHEPVVEESATEEDVPEPPFSNQFRTFIEVEVITDPMDADTQDEVEAATSNSIENSSTFRIFQIPTEKKGEELRVFVQTAKGSSGGAEGEDPYILAASTIEVEAFNGFQFGDETGEREDPVPFVWPAEKHWLSGYNFSAYHPGIDIAAYWDDLIFVSASGKVVSVNYSKCGYGNLVLIDHLNGYKTLYAHLNKILVEKGSFVIQGQPIGLAGSTGNSTGTHLHFEIHYQGRFVNPWHFLKQ